MNIKSIKTDADYRAALKEAETLMTVSDPEACSQNGEFAAVLY